MMPARKYYTEEAAREARIAQTRAARAYARGMREDVRLEPVRAVKPIHQVFLSVTLPVIGSYGFGAVVRRSL